MVQLSVFNSEAWPSARDENQYVEFSGEAAADAALSFTVGSTLSFMARRSNAGPPNVEVMYRVDNASFTTLETFELPDTDEHELSFSLEELGRDDDVYFRLLGWGSTHDLGTLRFDDVQVSFGLVAAHAKDVAQIPSAFELLSVYPNPFKAPTTLDLDVNREQRVSVELVDVLRRRIQVSATPYVGAGRHQVSVNAGGLPSGTYFIRVVGENAIASRPVILMK